MSGFSHRTAGWFLVLPGLCLLAACSPPATYEPAPETSDPFEIAALPPTAVRVGDTGAQDVRTYSAETPHIHGSADLVVGVDNNFVTISMDAPLANFGLSETSRKSSNHLEAYAEGLTELKGDARCDVVERSAQVARNGEHSVLTLSIVWDCRRPSRLDGLMFSGFDKHPGFDQVSVAYLGDDTRPKVILTPESPFLPFVLSTDDRG